MWRRIRRQLTFANIASGLSLFLVLSTGTAMALVGTNTVFSDDIVNGQVGSPDLKNGGVQAVDLEAGTWHAVTANPLTATNPCTTAPVHTVVFCGYTKTPNVDEYTYWGNYGGGWQGARFQRDVTGEVHLQGLVKRTEHAAQQDFGPAIFYLPTGFRPAKGLMFHVVCSDPLGDAFGHGRVDIGADGSVRWAVAAECSADGPGGYLSLSGISFPAD